ncbi:hypothetical protein QJS10_CPA02g00960 [Acorus calamus]|uniref:AB hydrolase-1 domain-containing protein n=1 Tax=Acorus calamus TaxID=4465 RepID=A0AAV9FCV7_ACOCL|nr:hypothetical protein QJS10_CPA02g00960 [Acorus calamus]
MDGGFFPGLITRISAALLIGFLAWAYQAIQPPPPNICGSPNGPSELYEKLGIYIVYFDRPGYGESDAYPNLSIKSIALDIEELADKLDLGSKFYVIGYSMGGQVHLFQISGSYVHLQPPNSLAGAALLAPVVNYWWPGFPANLSKEVYNKQLVQDQWTLRVAHYFPWLMYWWNTQQWFPASSVKARDIRNFPPQDLQLLNKFSGGRESCKTQVTQQGEFYSLHQTMIVDFGRWEFDPMDLKNPFPKNEGSVPDLSIRREGARGSTAVDPLSFTTPG